MSFRAITKSTEIIVLLLKLVIIDRFSNALNWYTYIFRVANWLNLGDLNFLFIDSCRYRKIIKQDPILSLISYYIQRNWY